MKQLPSILMTIFTSVLIFVLLSFGQPNIAASAAPAVVQSTPDAQPGCDPSRSVQVSGTAVINVTPDRAMIQLGVQSNGATIQEVEQANSSATQAVIKAVRALGIDGQYIATDWYVIEPIYKEYDSLSIKGYRIQNMVAITLHDVSKTSQVMSAALRAGANQVINVDFYTSELRKYRDQAREMAMQAAGEKAQALAAAAGAEAGCVLSINENSWASYYGGWYGRGQNQNQWTQNVLQNIAPSNGASSGSGDEPISLGMVSVRAEIHANFAIK